MDFSNFPKTTRNESTVKIIKEMIKSDKVPGAFIFEGAGESGRTIISDILAKTIVCRDAVYKKRYGEPCGICVSCMKADKKIHPDIIVAEPEGDSALSFHIDKVRDIIGGLYLAPNDGETKVYVIKDMQNMTPQGQNALLKSIEEPPPFAFFIITADNCDLILETVKSRAVKFTVDCAGEAEKTAASPAYAGLIRDILTQNPDKLSMYQKLSAAGLEKADKIAALKFYSELENAVRDILVAKIFMPYENSTGSGVPLLYFSGAPSAGAGGSAFEELRKLANLYSARKILNFSKKIYRYKSDLDYNVNTRLNLTSFLSSLTDISVR